MNAILLCAGFGTRMYPLTSEKAKALLPIGGRPLLDFLIDQLINLQVVEEIHLVANNRFYIQFREWQNDWVDILEAQDIKLCLYNDGVNSNLERLGAVGDLNFVLDEGKLWNQPSLVLAGDNLFRFSFRPVFERFESSKKNTVIALLEKDRSRLKRTGVIEFSDDGKITRFEEKPEKPFSNFFCPPAYFLTPTSINLVPDYLSTQGGTDSIGLFIKHLSRISEVYAVEVEGGRLDIGSLEDYSAAQKMFGG